MGHVAGIEELAGGACVVWVVVGRWKLLTEELKEREQAILMELCVF